MSRVRPTLYGDRDRWGLVHGDTLALMPQLPEASVSAICCDPPYGIALGDHAWDGHDIDVAMQARTRALGSGEAFQEWTRLWGREALRVLRPGGYVAAFGSPRTFHRLVAGLETAGLEIRDQVVWMYGSGMPKSRRIPGDLGTALKPAYEPIVLARRPPGMATSEALHVHGTGALNVAETRVPDRVRSDDRGEPSGRWPANVVWTHHPACGDACHGDCPAPLIDRGQRSLPSRFFYSGKAATSEREAGCEHLTKRDAALFSTPHGKSVQRANHHPTPKPIDLMRWLTKLVTPRGGVVLDPFAGSGSGGIAALLEGRQWFGIERQADYVEIARARLGHWAQVNGDGELSRGERS